MRCEVCPVPPGLPCFGLDHPPTCDDVRAGLPGRAAQLLLLADPWAPRPAAVRGDDVAAAIDADLCPHGAGACGCGAEPRRCGHPERPAFVWRAACLRCSRERAWERAGAIV